MIAVHIVIGFAVLQFFFFGILVGNARAKYRIPAPAVVGHEIFERYQRVHYNTMELLVMFIPASYLFATYISEMWAALLGLVYLAGRFLYLRLYISDPAKRGHGFGLSTLPIVILLLGGLGGAIWQAFG